jgi:rhodanese-related sulfurtransferase
MTLKRVSPEEASLAMRDGYLYLDVRSPDEFALGHPQGAFNVPWLDPSKPAEQRAPNPRFLDVMRANFKPEQAIVVGCQTGRRSLAAAETLLKEGYSQIIEQRAGFAGSKDAFGGVTEPGWQRAGLPVSFEAEPGRDYRTLSDGKKPGSER